MTSCVTSLDEVAGSEVAGVMLCLEPDRDALEEDEDDDEGGGGSSRLDKSRGKTWFSNHHLSPSSW